MTTRRGFLGAIAGLVAGATLDPERALWVPGKKLISIPHETTWQLVSMRWEITKELLDPYHRDQYFATALAVLQEEVRRRSNGLPVKQYAPPPIAGCEQSVTDTRTRLSRAYDVRNGSHLYGLDTWIKC